MARSIFERYGGFATVRKIISEFYDRMLDSKNLAPYFASTDMARLIEHQTQFVTFIMGGPTDFKDEALRRAHVNLEISENDFDEMVEIMTETLEDAGLDATDVGVVAEQLTSRKALILGKG